MDTALSKNVIPVIRNRTQVLLALVVIATIGAILLLRSGIKSSIDFSEIRTAVVEMGPIDKTLNASGEIIPEFEQVISSPINAAIKEVIRDAGSVVKNGDAILSLDKAPSNLPLLQYGRRSCAYFYYSQQRKVPAAQTQRKLTGCS